MANAVEFTRDDQVSGREGFASIKFGAYAEALEIELNELQRWSRTLSAVAVECIGNGFLTSLINNPNIVIKKSVSGVETVVTNYTENIVGAESLIFEFSRDFKILAKGIVFTVPSGSKMVLVISPSMTINVTDYTKSIYLNYKIVEVAYTSTLKEFGYNLGAPIPNPILDDYSHTETSRRYQYQWSLSKYIDTSGSYTDSVELMTSDKLATTGTIQSLNTSITNINTNIADIRATYLKKVDLIPSLPISSVTTFGIVRRATSNEVKNYVTSGYVAAEDLKLVLGDSSLIDRIYPIGSIYTTIDKSFDPAIKFGGQWELYGQGRFLLGRTETNLSALDGTVIPSSVSPGSGGSWNKSLSIGHMPNHNHYFDTSTLGAGNHQHRVDDHAHYLPGHQHVIPFGERPNFYVPWGGDGQYNHWGFRAQDNDNQYTYTSPTDGWSHGASPFTTWSGDHYHRVAGYTNANGSGTPFALTPPFSVAIFWRRTG